MERVIDANRASNDGKIAYPKHALPVAIKTKIVQTTEPSLVKGTEDGEVANNSKPKRQAVQQR